MRRNSIIKKSALVMSVVAAFALTAFSFDSTAEAAFGLKLPAIGSVIKGVAPNPVVAISPT